jgi:hypothetical protein
MANKPRAGPPRNKAPQPSHGVMPIRFREPRLERKHSGNLCLLLTEAGTWESFEAFAVRWAQQIGAKIEDRVDGPDVRVWRLSYEDRAVDLVYDDFPNGISVEAVDADSNDAIAQLFALVSSQASSNGV